MIGERCRLVTEQDGDRHVLSVVLAPGEIDAQLALEAVAHRMAGWTVAEFASGIVCVRAGIVRRVWAQIYDPMGDELGAAF